MLLGILSGRWPLSSGARLGKYRLLRRLAVGGMAEIFLARVGGIKGFEKLVVLKRILPQHAHDEQLTRMFLDEARLMATLDHPNITQVYDVGQARSSYFFAMEYVHGEDARRILKASLRAGHPVPAEHAIGIITGAAAGLHYAHEKVGPDGQPLQIVHRDVSPSNVLVSYDGTVKVADFGVAKWTAQQTKTVHGTLKGKFQYMSPEQCRGEPLDRRSDVFALGILLYELTTGTRLYQGASDYAILHQIVNNDATPPSVRQPGYAPELEQIVLRALARDRNARFQTAEELQLALEEFARERKLVVSPVARARYMEELFGGKIEAWRTAIQLGRSLGQHLAALPPEVSADPDERSVPGLNGATGTAGTRGEHGTPAGPVGTLVSLFSRTSKAGFQVRRRRVQAVVFSVAAGLALVFGLATFAARRSVPEPRPPSLPAAAPVVAAPVIAAPVIAAPVVKAPVEAPAATPVPKAPPAEARKKGRHKAAIARGARKKSWDPDSVFLP
jgi:eukaryotic-like serine/threonine-protein kinase